MVYTEDTIEVYDGSMDATLLLSEMDGYIYRVRTVPLPHGAYTFTVWAKADSNMQLSIDVLGKNEIFDLEAGRWTRLHILNENPTEDENGDIITYVDFLPVYGSNSADLHLYKAMLEQSNHASDWKPAPEDTEESILELTERIKTAELQINSDSIISKVFESQKYQSDQEELKNEIQSTVTQTVDAVVMEFSEVETMASEAKSYVDEATTWQRFDADGIHLGKDQAQDGHKFTMDLSNQELAFNDNGAKVAYINNQTMHITNAEIISRLTLGQFAFVPTETGMALIYVG